MENTFKQLNETIFKSDNKQFITYCYNNLSNQRLTCFCKKVNNQLYIKVYTINPKEQFSKKYIKNYHNEHGYFSNVGILHVVNCNRKDYKNFFFEILSKYYILNNEAVTLLLEKQQRKNNKKKEKEIKLKPLMHINV